MVPRGWRYALLTLALWSAVAPALADFIQVRGGRRAVSSSYLGSSSRPSYHGRSGPSFVTLPSAPDETDRSAYSPPARNRATSFAGENMPTLLQRIQRRLYSLGYYTGRCDGADNLDYRDALDHYRIRNNIPSGRSLNQAELQVLLGPDG